MPDVVVVSLIYGDIARGPSARRPAGLEPDSAMPVGTAVGFAAGGAWVVAGSPTSMV